MNKKLIASYIFFIFLLSSICFASDSVYVWSSINSSTANTTNNPSKGNIVNNTVTNNITANNTYNFSTNAVNSVNNEIANNSIKTSASVSDNNSLNLESGSAILIDESTGNVLYSHNAHEKLRPASVTKVMSLLLIMEAIDSGKISLEDKVPCSEKAHSMGGSQIWLDTTETLTVNDMLKSMCVVSANDCTVAMAEFIGGSEENFVLMMNEKAKQLGMNDTTFKNCHGIDEDGHVTSAYDIAVMSKELLHNHPKIKDYTTIWMDSIRDGKSRLVNTNKLIRNYNGATGLKTGSTSLALYNLSASATRDNLSLIAVLMKAPSTKIRFSEATKLLDYGFANYSSKSFGKRNDIVTTEKVNKGIVSEINLVLENDANILVKKGNESNVEQNLIINENIQAPINKGDVLGKITYTLNGNQLLEVNLIADIDIAKSNFWNLTTSLYSKWFNMIR